MEEKGIKELKELVSFIALFINATDKATKDGFDIGDIATFMVPLMKAPQAFSGLSEAKLEYADLSSEEIMELNKVLADELDLESEKVENLVEKSLSVMIQIYSIIKSVRDLKA